MNKYIQHFSRLLKPILIAISLSLFCCEVQEYIIEVRVSDWTYGSILNNLIVYLEAENTGDLAVKKVSCKVSVTVDGITKGIKNVTFNNGNKIKTGDKATETISFLNIDMSTTQTLEIEPSDIKAEPIKQGPSCSHPFL